ncbi:MAG: type I 3-dehydroquinate dehydratase, partial [Verrucomicrobia bacterium]|nr:type I 3-dehydroquinate dehydratase [Verrucomicrobiota bacterium]
MLPVPNASPAPESCWPQSPPPESPLVVGVMHDRASLVAACALPPAGAPATPDLLELRADAFAADLAENAAACPEPALNKNNEPLRAVLAAPRRPLLLTVRHPREGGMDGSLTAARRLGLFRRLLPHASWVDVELRSLLAPALAAAEFRTLLAGARARGCHVVVSFHDFCAT